MFKINHLKINNMERNITVTLEKAKEWYNSNNTSLREIALQAFSKEELTGFDFTKIKTFEDACNVLNLDRKAINYLICVMVRISKASVAMFKLNIIRKALNLGKDLHLTKNPENSSIYYPRNQFITIDSTYYEKEISSGKVEVIGKIKSEGILYRVLSGGANSGNYYGLGSFSPFYGVGFVNIDPGLLGCASKEIARHFGKYFGMLITEAKYGDMVDFEIVENKYQ